MFELSFERDQLRGPKAVNIVWTQKRRNGCFGLRGLDGSSMVVATNGLSLAVLINAPLGPLLLLVFPIIIISTTIDPVREQITDNGCKTDR